MEKATQRAYWAEETPRLLESLSSRAEGLRGQEAAERLRAAGQRQGDGAARLSWCGTLLRQFASPLVALLLGAALLSYFLGERADAAIIVGIVAVSSLLGFVQEHRAGNAARKLVELVQTRVDVLRDGVARVVLLEEVVPGDVALLRAGTSIPGDGVLLEGNGLLVDQSTLTGEALPVEKRAGIAGVEAGLAERTNAVFAGTHVVSGFGRMVVVATGARTEFGRIAKSLRLRSPETEFERGIRHFGYLLLELTLLLTLGVFAVNVIYDRPALESFLFSLALAVGLTPQLLPAVIAVNLARGAQAMARADVIVKRLGAIEDFGGMTVLCSDKTGTLTAGTTCIREAVDAEGASSDDVIAAARLNAVLQRGYRNPIDDALAASGCAAPSAAWVDEIPYDFVRKRLTVLAREGGRLRLVTKGAFESVLACCDDVRTTGGRRAPVAELTDALRRRVEHAAARGLRVLGVAERLVDEPPPPLRGDSVERGMTFLGLLVLEDPLREDCLGTVRRLETLGVRLKIVTGDHRLVAAEVARAVGLSGERLVTGHDLHHMSDAALLRRAPGIDVFAEVEPSQKERIVHALRKAGFVVGYVGDGINDAAAIHAADVGISVASAADVAKEAADFVLLKPGLAVLVRGIVEGRKVFANTLKYVFMAASANFGNMFSMAGASLLLPFLPLLPKQILFMNVLTDLPEMTIASDRVDPEWVETPQGWDVPMIRRFMIVFGALSSVFDYATFGLLWWWGRGIDTFRTGWFTESVISAALVVLVVRTRRSLFHSHPGRALTVATLAVALSVLALPWTPIAPALGLVPLDPSLLAALLGIVLAYLISAEALKRLFHRCLSRSASTAANHRPAANHRSAAQGAHASGPAPV
jgi:Mg2+-importing ATPase